MFDWLLPLMTPGVLYGCFLPCFQNSRLGQQFSTMFQSIRKSGAPRRVILKILITYSSPPTEYWGGRLYGVTAPLTNIRASGNQGR